MTMPCVEDPGRRVKVIEDVDVCVLGGGPGGMPAAIAAARRGLDVLIVERYGFFGGLATAGLMGPLFGYAPYGLKPRKLILGGIPVEFVRRLQEVGGAPDDGSIDWAAVRFDPELLKHVCDRLVTESGARVLFHSYSCDVIMDGDRIDAAIIECKSGRKAIRARVFVDATGDGDVAARAGAAFTKGRRADGLTQAIGTKFIVGGVRSMTAGEQAEAEAAVVKAIADKTINAYHTIGGEISDQGVSLREDERTPTITRCKGDGTDVYDVTAAELKLRRDSYDIVDFYRRNVRGYEKAYIRQTPAQVGVRETRQILGGHVLDKSSILEWQKRPRETIARGCWFLDIHCPRGLVSSAIEEGGMCSKRCKVKPDCYMKDKFPDQLPDEPFWGNMTDYYDIPYACLVPRTPGNLLISGRCISADHFAMSSVRVIGTCMAIGEAAGTAAALCVRRGISPRELAVGGLQRELRDAAVPLGDDS